MTRYQLLNETLERSKHELETAYEELQSTAEELETTNEELQSTNEELETMNDELRRNSDELNQVNAFLESILMSLHGGVVVVDTKLCVLARNESSADLWGLRAEEVEGEHFLGLDIGLPVGQLAAPVRAVLAGEPAPVETTLDATNRRGRAISVLVTGTPLLGRGDEVRGAILVMEDLPREES